MYTGGDKSEMPENNKNKKGQTRGRGKDRGGRGGRGRGGSMPLKQKEESVESTTDKFERRANSQQPLDSQGSQDCNMDFNQNQDYEDASER